MLKFKPSLTEKQLERLSSIFDNAGQVIFGLAVFSPIIAGVDRVNLFVILSGIVGVIVCWAASLWFARR